MAIRSKLFSFFTLLFAVTAFTVFATAQETTPAPKDDAAKAEKREHRGFGKRGDKMGRHGGHGMRGFHGIELTDAQKEQFRAIHAANKPSPETIEQMRTLREAKRNGTLTADQEAQLKQFRQDQRAKGEAIKAQIDNILTPEQKAQVEARKQEMRQKMQEHRQRRQQQKTEPAKPIDN
jgi:Spy/CpxP family protein refolding chaperone